MRIIDKLGRILSKATIWAFSGALFGGFFAGVLSYLHTQQGDSGWLGYLIASAVAGTMIAAFFGSMLVALGGTLTGILTSISYQLLFPSEHQPLLLFGAAFILGLVAGGFFTRREIREAQPLAQAAAGLFAGLLSGPLLFLIIQSTGIGSTTWAVSAVSVSLVGLFYVVVIKNIPAVLRSPVALRLGGPVVAGLIAVSVAAVFWLIGESYMIIPELGQTNPYQSALDEAPLGLIGGALGGAFGGAMLELLGIQLEEHIH